MHQHKQSDNLQAKQDALDAWAKLPQGKPSNQAMPPAGGGLMWFLGFFADVANPFRQHKRAIGWVLVGLGGLGIIALMWQWL
jgi:hypothetical protein